LFSAHALRVLQAAREALAADGERLTAVRGLSDNDRHVLRPVLRQWSVRIAAYWLSPLRYLQFSLLAFGLVVCVVTPPAALAVPAARALSVPELILASTVYLSSFGVSATVSFRLVGGVLFARLARLGLLGSSLCVAAAVVLIGWHGSQWPAVGFGVVAGVLGSLAIFVAWVAAGVLGTFLWFPVRRRLLASLPPCRAVAARLWFLLDALDAASGSWRQAQTRKDLLAWVTFTSYWLERRMPLAMWMGGYRGPAYREAAQRYQQAAGFVRSMAWRITDASDRAKFDQIARDLADVAVGLAAGDWTVLPRMQQRTGASRLAAVGRRLVAPAVLGAAALVLPHLPGVTLSGSALTTFQVALLVAATLSLTSLDPASREQILGAFTDSHRRG
jgi:hypothetical protein